uniref:SF3A2 domain-containing protein n=1 Tax=Physcomitrium patens TaxID=3218 RepID=A0A2K1KLZ4_PHYPA|nr:hypothetical protein PHYPA_005684 [Physcomitrium patens]
MRHRLSLKICKLYFLWLDRIEADLLGFANFGVEHQALDEQAASWIRLRSADDALAQPQPNNRKVNPRKTITIGRLSYRITKQFDQETRQRSLLFQLEYSEIEEGTKIRHRFMSSCEQRGLQPQQKAHSRTLLRNYKVTVLKCLR